MSNRVLNGLRRCDLVALLSHIFIHLPPNMRFFTSSALLRSAYSCSCPSRTDMCLYRYDYFSRCRHSHLVLVQRCDDGERAFREYNTRRKRRKTFTEDAAANTLQRGRNDPAGQGNAHDSTTLYSPIGISPRSQTITPSSINTSLSIAEIQQHEI